MKEFLYKARSFLMYSTIASSKVTINGKTVNIEAKAKSKMPVLDQNVVWIFGNKAQRYPQRIETIIYESYIKKQRRKFFEALHHFLLENLIKALRTKPDSITSDPFKIIILYHDLNNFIGGIGYVQLYSEKTIYLEVKIKYVIQCILTSDPQEMFGTLVHELGHHLDKEKSEEEAKVGQRIHGIVKRKKFQYPVNVYYLQHFFASFRLEGLQEFENLLARDEEFTYDPRIFTHAIKLIKVITNTFDRKKLEGIVRDKTLAYKVGNLMVSLIVLHYLFLKDKKFSAWVKSLDVFSEREFNAVEIRMLYKQGFKMTFRKEETNGLLDEAIRYVYSLGYLTFVKEYENACDYFKVEPFITLKLYDSMKKKCISNFLASVKG